MERHPVEVEMGLSASEILDVIKRSDRCYQTVRGFVAERHLEILLEGMKKRGEIEAYLRLNSDGKPDFQVRRHGVWQTVECKNVKTDDVYKRGAGAGDRKVDFQRTRNQKGSAATTGRFYKPNEFDVLAAAEHTPEGVWTFKFTLVADLPTEIVEGVVCCVKVVRVPSETAGTKWSTSLCRILDSKPS